MLLQPSATAFAPHCFFWIQLHCSTYCSIGCNRLWFQLRACNVARVAHHVSRIIQNWVVASCCVRPCVCMWLLSCSRRKSDAGCFDLCAPHTHTHTGEAVLYAIGLSVNQALSNMPSCWLMWSMHTHADRVHVCVDGQLCCVGWPASQQRTASPYVWLVDTCTMHLCVHA